MKQLVITLAFLALTFAVTAQQDSLEEYFFASGRIKVVIAVATSIAVGLFIYLWRLDKKISDLEKDKS